MSQPRLADRLDLAAVPSAVICSRMFAKLTLTKWGAWWLIDDALLIVSELTTNAVRATGITEPRPRWSDLARLNFIGVRLLGFDTSIVIEVWDCDPNEPVIKEAELDDERGRGLAIIDNLAHRWGSYPSNGGKVVWAQLPVYPGTVNRLPQRPRSPRSPTGVHPPQHDQETLRRIRDGLEGL